MYNMYIKHTNINNKFDMYHINFKDMDSWNCEPDC